MHFVQLLAPRLRRVVAAAFGSFSAGRAQEVVVARQGGALELLRPDEATGRLATVASTATFSLRAAALRLAPTRAATRDVDLAVGHGTRRCCASTPPGGPDAHPLETFKARRAAGARERRPVGGAPTSRVWGRAVMVAAVERTKLRVHAEAEPPARATMAARVLEAHKARAASFAAVAHLDVGFEVRASRRSSSTTQTPSADASGEAARDAEKVLTATSSTSAATT